MPSFKKVYSYISKYFSVFLLLFFTFSFLYTTDHSFNQDLGRHIKFGEIITQTLQVPNTNLFSYTYPTFSFVNHHWLFGVLVYLGSISIGLQGVLILKVLLLLTSVFIVLVLANRIHSLLFFPLTFLFLHMIRGRIELRPEILSFLFTTLTYYILDKFNRSDTKFIYVLPFISLLWVNSHIYYPVGIFLQCIYLGSLLINKYIKKDHGEKLLDKLKSLSIVTLASVIASTINPNFIKGALYPFTVFNNYGVTITENQTIATLQSIGFINPDFLFFYLCVLTIAIAFLVGVIRNRITILNAGLLCLGLVLSFQSVRGFPYMLFLCLPSVLYYLAIERQNMWIKVVNGIVCIVLIVESSYYLSGAYYNQTYKKGEPALYLVEDAKPALDFVLEKNLPQPIFNNFDIGSYILYRTYPSYKVFIDGRPEAYPAGFFTDTYLPMQEEYSVYKEKEKEYGFKTIIFSITDQNPRTVKFLKEMDKNPGWNIGYLDHFMIVFVRKDEASKRSITAIQLENLNLNKHPYSDVVAYTNLSTLMFNLEYYDKAKEINQKALDISPENPAANKIMANILLRDDKPQMTVINEHLRKTNSPVFW